MKKKFFASLLLLLLTAFMLQAQNILDAYIKEGLESNHALKQKQLTYRQSILELKKAKSMFYPDISLNARYSVAEGGRTIEFPVGDLLNPVYQSLNMLMQSDKFPEIGNQEFYFLRPHEQETKLSLVQPLFNTDIYYNNKIKEEQLYAADMDLAAYKRSLIAEIKTAYYNFLQAEKSMDIYNQIIELLDENVRVNKSLYDNDKVTLDVVYRSEAELSKVKKELVTAGKNVQLAKAYFNFLLNRPLDSTIEEVDAQTLPLPEQELEFFRRHAIDNREDLQQIDFMISAVEQNVRRSKGSFYPSLTAAVDYGIQGEEYQFNDEYDFLLASVIFKWKLFSGKSRNYQLQQARLDIDILHEKKEQAVANIKMEVMKAYYNMVASAKAVKAAEDEVKSASGAFRLIKNKYEQGQAGLLEYLDAGTSLKNARIGKTVAEYQFLADHALFEKAAAISKIDYEK